jgi:hypothetical protein
MGRPPKTGIDPLKIFLHAGSFHKSYDLLCKSVVPKDGEPPSEQDVGIIAHPSMMLSVFSSELYLKCLICMETGAVPDGHNLKLLFETLSVPARREIDDLWDADIRHPGKAAAIERIRTTPTGKNLRLDLRYALDVGANSFAELRYFYEKEATFFYFLTCHSCSAPSSCGGARHGDHSFPSRPKA